MTDFPEVDFDKDIDVWVNIDLNFDVDVKIDKDSDVHVHINVDADIKGNSAELILSVEAYGWDTYTQADVAILTIEDTLSSIDLYAVSAVN